MSDTSTTLSQKLTLQQFIRIFNELFGFHVLSAYERANSPTFPLCTAHATLLSRDVRRTSLPDDQAQACQDPQQQSHRRHRSRSGLFIRLICLHQHTEAESGLPWIGAQIRSIIVDDQHPCKKRSHHEGGYRGRSSVILIRLSLFTQTRSKRRDTLRAIHFSTPSADRSRYCQL